jgi:hypothetical protein
MRQCMRSPVTRGGAVALSYEMCPEVWRDMGDTRAPQVFCSLDQAEGASIALIHQAHRDGPGDAANTSSGRAG